MKRILLTLFAVAWMTTVNGGDLPLSDGDLIAFAGDSNMSQLRWVHYVASYLVLMNPTLRLHIWCAARSGTSVSQWLDDPSGYNGYNEYSKSDYAMQPRYVFAMLGVNGGESPSAHAVKMQDLVANYIIAQNGATPIVMGPICGISTNGNLNLRDKDDSITALCATYGWTNIRTWHDLSTTWTNPANFTRLLDSITTGHPSTAGHIQEAYLIIKDLSWSTTVSNATLNASNASVTDSNYCTISNVTSNTYGGIDFDRLDARLPWAIDEVGNDGIGRAEAVAMLPELSGWLDYSVKVTNLPSGNYNVFCDGVQIGSNVSTLGTGWNMADLTFGPVFDQVHEVLGRIRDMQGVDRVSLTNKNPNKGIVRWRSNAGAYYGSQGKRGAELIAAMQPAVTELNGYDDLIHAAAQPVTRHYSVRLHGGAPSPSATSAPSPTATCSCCPT